ncbi:MAG: methylmalonyl Co-A mutase-associated GTPase MeaB [Myxococcales bacterium]|nr:methylmalonyl Co-A mutase-associated GTPase MeaB [Myxococcales bacterium]
MSGAPSQPPRRRRRRLTLDEYEAGVRARDRVVLGRAITLIESNAAADQQLAQELLGRLLPSTGGAVRVGITGVPGVGKSTFIETFGKNLTGAGHRVAVLAVDPTSSRTSGSILGDKTRMTRLSSDPSAFIRPSPSSGSLGGVARKTRETMLICEAAGFDIILVETVGVGQSETVVADMVDFFLVLMLPNAGDELQGIKRGILELADLIAVNKADTGGESARLAKREYINALRMMHGGAADAGWQVPVLTISGLNNSGLDVLWDAIGKYRAQAEASGALENKRRDQLKRWMWSMVDEAVLRALRQHPDVARIAPGLEAEVLAGKKPPTLGARRLLEAFGIDAL